MVAAAVEAGKHLFVEKPGAVDPVGVRSLIEASRKASEKGLSIREGKPINEGVRLAEATMTGVMGRMSAYTGRALKWDWAMNASTPGSAGHAGLDENLEDRAQSAGGRGAAFAQAAGSFVM